MRTSHTYPIFAIVLLGLSACEDFVDVDMPNSQINSASVFGSNETAIAAATGMYVTMLQSGSFVGHSFNPISYLGGLSSDELVDYTGTAPYAEFFNNELSVNNSTVLNVWRSGYRISYEANAVIQGVTSSAALSPNIKKQLEGEARFVRAFAHFYLVNLFGDVPVVTSTDYRLNATIQRSHSSDVYNQIKTDLIEAKELLTEEYFLSGRSRPNRSAASALLARVYLYTKEYGDAEREASAVIGNSMYELQQDLNRVFLTNSAESILQLSQVYPHGFPTADAQNLIIVNSPFSSTVRKALSQALVTAFEPNDARQDNWINTYTSPSAVIYYYPYKYKVRVYAADANYPESLVLLRLAEQYLIRAEARTELGEIEGAKNDLNVIRHRAGLGDTDANDPTSLRIAIENERRLELFAEMGHRWLDLKRTNRADAVLASLKTSWESTDVYYPLPEQEMLNNPYLMPQNDGY